MLSARVFKKYSGRWSGTLESSWEFNDGFNINFTLNASPGDVWFTFRHTIRADDKREISYRVRAMATPVRFGGFRWWWICPHTGRRVFKLYLPNGGWQFWSRQAHGLGCECQRETMTDRRMRRARRLHRALGGDGKAIGQAPPPKPKGMRWRTYERKVAEWQTADDEANANWMRDALRRFPHLGR